MADPAKPSEANDYYDFMRRLLDRMDVARGRSFYLSERGENWFRDRFLGHGSEVKWFGMDQSTQPSVSVECTWHNGETIDVRVVAEPKAQRREPFPNPEAMAYRPKV